MAKDETGASLERQVLPNPIEGHYNPVSNTDQKIDVGHAPEYPSDEARQTTAAERDDGAFASNRREIAQMTVVKDGGLGT